MGLMTYSAGSRVLVGFAWLVSQPHAPPTVQVHPEGAVLPSTRLGVLVVVVGQNHVAVLFEGDVDELLGEVLVARGEL